MGLGSLLQFEKSFKIYKAEKIVILLKWICKMAVGLAKILKAEFTKKNLILAAFSNVLILLHGYVIMK